VQAQDYAAAKWALSLRLGATSATMTDAAIERALDAGTIVRTHAMRPTWHFLAADDVRWVQELTAGRVHTVNGNIYRKLELDAKTLARAHDVLAAELSGGRFATRAELGAALERRRIEASGQRLAYIVMHAELSSLVCSGPRRGKQLTYALLDERVPAGPPVPREEALRRLAHRYFVSHGPARVADFSWWSGLSMSDARSALAAAEPDLSSRTSDEDTVWSAPGLRAARRSSPLASLLSVYDEYVVAYRDRRDIGSSEFADRLYRMGAALTSVLAIDGVIAGTWKRTLSRGAVTVAVQPFRKLTKPEQVGVGRAAALLGRHLGLDAETAIS
jgi:Winged helix DNA-binding domain